MAGGMQGDKVPAPGWGGRAPLWAGGLGHALPCVKPWRGDAIQLIAAQAYGSGAWGLRTCSRSFWRSHCSAIGMSGCFGCAAWARAHASSRGAKTPSSSARFHSNPAGKCLAGRSAALRRLPIARAIGGAPRLASHPGKVLVRLQKDFEQALRRYERARQGCCTPIF